jgi:hypothetical protein
LSLSAVWCLISGYRAIHTDIRKDLLDAYIFIQQRLNGKLAEERRIGHSVVDVNRCIAFGGSAGGTACLYLVRIYSNGNMREGIDLSLIQAADIESHNNNHSPSSPALPQLRAIICAYPLTNPDSHPAEPKAVWAEKTSKMVPGDWELIKDYPEKGKVCTGYAFPIGRYVKQVGSAFALPDHCDRFDTCRDPRLLFAKSASHESIIYPVFAC